METLIWIAKASYTHSDAKTFSRTSTKQEIIAGRSRRHSVICLNSSIALGIIAMCCQQAFSRQACFKSFPFSIKQKMAPESADTKDPDKLRTCRPAKTTIQLGQIVLIKICQFYGQMCQWQPQDGQIVAWLLYINTCTWCEMLKIQQSAWVPRST